MFGAHCVYSMRAANCIGIVSIALPTLRRVSVALVDCQLSSLFVCLSVCRPACLPVCLSICSVCPSVALCLETASMALLVFNRQLTRLLSGTLSLFCCPLRRVALFNSSNVDSTIIQFNLLFMQLIICQHIELCLLKRK